MINLVHLFLYTVYISIFFSGSTQEIKSGFQCTVCGKNLTTEKSLKRLKCRKCSNLFKSNCSSVHPGFIYECPNCDYKTMYEYNVPIHKKTHEKNKM